MNAQRFEAKLVRPDAVGSWTYLIVPFDVEQVYGTKARVAVKGTVNGHPYRSSLMPQGNNVHIMVVNKSLREQAGASVGDFVAVTMERDDAAREVDVPDDFREALAEDAAADAAFAQLSYSHRKEYVDWIESAKKAQTRASRIAKAVDRIARNERLKS